MYLKKRDKDILQFIESYGSITVNICSKVYFKSSKYNYIEASRRLKLLHQNKYLRRTRNKSTSEYVYYNDKPRKLHDIYLLNVYAELVYSGFKIINFKREKHFMDKKYFVDGFFEIGIPIQDKFKHHSLLVEIDLTHKTSFTKMFDIYTSDEMQQYFKDEYNTDKEKFPTFLICSHTIPKKPTLSGQFRIEHLDFSLSGLIPKVMLDT